MSELVHKAWRRLTQLYLCRCPKKVSVDMCMTGKRQGKEKCQYLGFAQGDEIMSRLSHSTEVQVQTSVKLQAQKLV